MRKRTMTLLGFLLFDLCLVLPLVADQSPQCLCLEESNSI
jgi:hypothetical protein